MRDNYIPLNQHQVIDTNPSPFTTMIFPSLGCSIRPSNPQFRSNLAAPIQKQPDCISFPNPHRSSRYIRPIVENKRNQYLRILNRLLHNHKFFPKRISRLRLLFHRSLCHCLWWRWRIRIRRYPSGRQSGLINRRLRRRSRYTRIPRRQPRAIIPGIIIIIRK